jgi:hypothetical protein
VGDINRLAFIVEKMLREPDSSLRVAASVRDLAVVVLSRDSCHAPILAELSSVDPEPRSNGLALFEPYFSSFLSGMRQEITTLSRQEEEAYSRIRDLEVVIESLRSELAAVYASRTWRLGRALATPVRAIRQRRQHHPRRRT